MEGPASSGPYHFISFFFGGGVRGGGGVGGHRAADYHVG